MPSEELMRLARQAYDRSEAEKAKLAAMSPAEREAYIHAWAHRLAEEQIKELDRLASENGGCDCGQKHD